jgi:3-oxoacyl-[acyl-carrier protein] reductase
MNTEHKIAIVSGGSRGLGSSIVKNLLEKQYFVATFSRNISSDIDQFSNGKFKKSFFWKAVDASSLNEISTFTEEVNNKFGRVNVLINNVGMVSDSITTLMPVKTAANIIRVNLENIIHLTQMCIKGMLLNKNGIIINISSINAIRGHTGVAVYSATKAGIDGFTRSLAKELGQKGIRVNSIAPGYLETEMTSHLSARRLQGIIHRTPLGRLGKVEDIVDVINFLLSDQSKFITGQTFVVDGGMTC